MNKLKIVALMLISLQYLSCKCFEDACSGSVQKVVTVQLLDKTNLQPLNVSSYNLSLEGLPFASPTKGTGKDSSTIRFGGSGTFSTKGSFNGVFKLDGASVGKFRLTLEARECCEDYPELGKIVVLEGSLAAKTDRVSDGSNAYFILRL